MSRAGHAHAGVLVLRGPRGAGAARQRQRSSSAPVDRPPWLPARGRTGQRQLLWRSRGTPQLAAKRADWPALRGRRGVGRVDTPCGHWADSGALSQACLVALASNESPGPAVTSGLRAWLRPPTIKI